MPLVQTLKTCPFPTVISDVLYRSPDSLPLAFATPAELHSILPNSTAGPNSTDNKKAYRILHSFDEQSCSRIADPGIDNYLVTTSNLQVFPQTRPASGTYSLYRGNLHSWNCTGNKTTVDRLVDLPEAQYLMCMATLPTQKNSICTLPLALISDPTAGSILKFDPETKNYTTWLAHPTMAPPLNSKTPALEINALRYYNGCIYYTNTRTPVQYIDSPSALILGIRMASQNI
ncbi:hypothetical protein BCR34DRAFT_598285 [Clohesyomyces aquaticus]|uniref:Uncharacterized protein n=1 Tax=Clohesyomyces aquaticus TaxID=1231657 RepID=A0A1Y1ZZ70_9PLEO|nr:hypothetical protein BCR34DRAFT_598285 [Clohesyomyces aquaticus]